MKSRIIGKAFKDIIKHTNYKYDDFAPLVGLYGRQAVNHYLNHKTDNEWYYDDIRNWCRALNLDMWRFMEDVDRKRENLKAGN